LREPDRLERHRCELLVLRAVGVEELLPSIGAARLLEEHRPVEEVELCDLVAAPAAVHEHAARLAAQVLLVLGEGELHQRLRGRPRTRSATMFRRISLVPASIVFPRLRSCWWLQ